MSKSKPLHYPFEDEDCLKENASSFFRPTICKPIYSHAVEEAGPNEIPNFMVLIRREMQKRGSNPRRIELVRRSNLATFTRDIEKVTCKNCLNKLNGKVTARRNLWQEINILKQSITRHEKKLKQEREELAEKQNALHEIMEQSK